MTQRQVNAGSSEEPASKLGLSNGATPKRHRNPAWLASLLLLPGLASALSLGEIQVQSYLNEPFRATVPVRSLDAGDAEALKAALAGDQAFARLGLEKSEFLTELGFSVLPGRDPSQAQVVISSRRLAKEPFFSFLLQVQGARETLIREYTVLLDPNTAALPTAADAAAVSEPAAPAPSQAKPSVARNEQPAPAPVAAAPTPAPSQGSTGPYSGAEERLVPVPEPTLFQGANESAPAAPSYEDNSGALITEAGGPVVSDGGYGPVRKGETLWGIAAAVRPSANVTMNQVMWALYRANPKDFDGNLNLVKRGSVLDVPSEAEMRQVSRAEASALVAAENERLRSGAGKAAPTPAPTEQIDLESSSDSSLDSERMSADEASMPVEELPAVEPPEEAIELVADEPASQAMEDSAASDSSRAKGLQDSQAPDLGDADGMAESDYEALDELPMELGEDDAASDAMGDEMGDGVADASEQGLDAAADLDEELGSLEQDELSESAMAGEGDQSRADESGGSSWLIYLLMGLGIVVLLLLFLFMRRRREEEKAKAAAEAARNAGPSAAAAAAASAFGLSRADDEDELESATDEADTAAFADTEVSSRGDTAVMPQASESDTDFDATATFDAPLSDGPTLTQELEGEVSEEADASSEQDELAELDLPDDVDANETLDLGSETVSLELNEDPLSEADFQLAYGLYDEAALLLNRAIEAEPDRLDLREKLAETHFAASDADKFREAAENLKIKQPGDDVWQRVAIMGQQLCPGDDLFGLDAATATGNVDVDMDFGGNDTAEDDNSLEFSLDDEPGSESTGGSDDNFEADFDSLSLDEGGSDDAADEDVGDLALDDFDLGDLESELGSDESADAAASADDEFSLDLPEADEAKSESVDESKADEATDDNAIEFDLEDFGGTELELDDSAGEAEEEPSLDTGDLSADLTLSEGLDDLADSSSEDSPADSSADELSLEPADEPESSADSESGDFDLGDLDMEGTDFDLGDSAGGETDFDLGDEAGNETDFDLSDEAGSETDFDLGDLGDDSAADSSADELELSLDDDSSDGLDDLDLSGLDDDSSDSDDDFNLDFADEDTSTDGISSGDDAATKLDLARAYVDMGEGDMARSLLDEVIESGSDDQKSEAQSLIDKL